MTTADPNITTTFGTDMAEDSPQSKFTSFDHNIGVVTGAKLQDFVQSGEKQINFYIRVKESIPTNLYRSATLQYPAAPRYTEKDASGQWVPVTDPTKMASIKNEWAKGIARIIHVIPPPMGADENTITTTAFIEQWGKQNEGREVIFGAAEDKNGYVKVKSFTRADGKVAVVLRSPDDGAKNAKGEVIPGLSARDQAVQEIAKYRSKK